MDVRIVPATNADCPDINAVIQECYVEYGFTWETDGYNADTYDVEGAYAAKGGAFWVLKVDAQTVGTVGVKLHEPNDCELMRMYLLKPYRGQGLGGRMLTQAVQWGRKQGFRKMHIWSDVKLTDAHAMYAKRGAVPMGQRVCDDPDQSIENGFVLSL